MKLKVKTTDKFVIGFNRRELMIISGCLNEACHGMIMDRFVPAYQELESMLSDVREYTSSTDFFKLMPVSV
jgi:hypothetical protein